MGNGKGQMNRAYGIGPMRWRAGQGGAGHRPDGTAGVFTWKQGKAKSYDTVLPGPKQGR